MSDVEDDYRYSSGEEFSEQGEEEEFEVRHVCVALWSFYQIPSDFHE